MREGGFLSNRVTHQFINKSTNLNRVMQNHNKPLLDEEKMSDNCIDGQSQQKQAGNSAQNPYLPMPGQAVSIPPNYPYVGVPPNYANPIAMPPGPMMFNNMPYRAYMGQSQLPIMLPPQMTPAHPAYATVLQYMYRPCPRCNCIDSDYVSLQIGCTAIGWSVGLFLLCGILLFWIPLVSKNCRDIKITCWKCGFVKGLIERDCCN